MIMMTENVMITMKMVIIITVEIIVFIKMTSLTYKNISNLSLRLYGDIFKTMIVPNLYKFAFISLKNALCQVCLELVQWFRRRTFLKVAIVILVFAFIRHLKGAWSLMRTSLNPFNQRIFCTNLN